MHTCNLCSCLEVYFHVVLQYSVWQLHDGSEWEVQIQYANNVHPVMRTPFRLSA